MKLKKPTIVILLCQLSASPYVKEKSSKLWDDVLAYNESNQNSNNSDATKSSVPVIVMDAGHGGYDSGSVSIDGSEEKDIVLAIALQTGAMLTEHGYAVVYTRTSNEIPWNDDNLDDLRSRAHIAEQANADYYISIHINSSNYDDGAYGIKTYLDYTSDVIETMADNIKANLWSLQYTCSRGCKSIESNPLYIIDKNTVPALLLEIGFITDRDDATYMLSEAGQTQIASSIANGIIESLM